MNRRKEKIKKLTKLARESGLRHEVVDPVVDKIGAYPRETKDLMGTLSTLGVVDVILDEHIILGEMLSANLLEIEKSLNSPVFLLLIKKYNFVGINPNESLGQIVEKMHRAKN